MTQAKHLRDFQISFQAKGMRLDETAPINRDLFAFYCAIREWCQWRRPSAPFAKLVVDFWTYDAGPLPHVFCDPCGVCMACYPIDADAFFARTRELPWLAGQVVDALKTAEEKLGWDGSEVIAFVDSLRTRAYPLVQALERHRKVSKRHRLQCLPWVSSAPEGFGVGADVLDLSGELVNRVTILSSPKPIYVEDDFAIAKITVEDRRFRLLTREGSTLALVPFERSNP